MKRGRHTPEQIIRRLRDARWLLGGGTIPQAAKDVGSASALLAANQYAGMEANVDEAAQGV